MKYRYMIVNNKAEVQKVSEQKEKREGTPQAQRGDKDRKIAEMIAGQLQVKLWQVEAAVSLIDEGNTIPFIARYRKEATGTLDDEQLRTLDERLAYLRNLEDKKEKVIESIEAQGKLTAALRAQIEDAQTQVAVEDLYRPFRPKRRTRAGVAREKGLQGLADWILSQTADHPALQEAAGYVSAEKEVASAEDALQGAEDILAEMISDNADYRTWIRETTSKEGFVVSAKKEASAKAEQEAARKVRLNRIYSCQQDEDCLIVDKDPCGCAAGPSGVVAINVNYITDFNALQGSKMLTKACADQVSVIKECSPSARAVCKAHVCKIDY